MRLIKRIEGAEYDAKVYRNHEWNEFVVRFYRDKKYMGEGPTYYTDCKDDALTTAIFQIERYEDRYK